MLSFVRALTSRPANRNPAPGWQPLLKDPETKSVLCAVCHGDLGAMMEENIGRLASRRPADYADDRVFMVDLMERWVEEMNRNGRDLLAKPLSCTDCHEADPRKG
jgi:cytochrome c553